MSSATAIAEPAPLEVVVQQGHGDLLTGLRFTRDGALLVSAGWDNSVRLWDLQSQRLVRALSGPRTRVHALDVDAKGVTVVAGSEKGEVRQWDLASGRVLGSRVWFQGNLMNAVAALDGGARLVVSGGRDRVVDLYDVASERRLSRLTLRGEVMEMVVAPDGKTLAAYAAGPDPVPIDIADVRSGRRLRSMATPRAHLGRLAFGPRGRLASAGTDRAVRVWDVESGRLERTLSPPEGLTPGKYTDVVLGADGHTAAACTDRGFAFVWDLRTGNAVQTLRLPGSLARLALNPDSRRMAVGAANGAITLLAPPSPAWSRVGREWAQSGDGARRFRVRPTGVDEVSAGSDSRVLRSLVDPRGQYVRLVAATRDGRRVVAAGLGLTVWALPSGAVSFSAPGTSSSCG